MRYCEFCPTSIAEAKPPLISRDVDAEREPPPFFNCHLYLGDSDS